MEVPVDDVVRGISDLAFVGAVASALLGIGDDASLFGHESPHLLARDEDGLFTLAQALAYVAVSTEPPTSSNSSLMADLASA